MEAIKCLQTGGLADASREVEEKRQRNNIIILKILFFSLALAEKKTAPHSSNLIPIMCLMFGAIGWIHEQRQSISSYDKNPFKIHRDDWHWIKTHNIVHRLFRDNEWSRYGQRYLVYILIMLPMPTRKNFSLFLFAIVKDRKFVSIRNINDMFTETAK